MRQALRPPQVLSDFGLIKSQEGDDLGDLDEGRRTCRRSFKAMQPSTCPSGCRHKSKQGGRQGLESSRHLSLLRVLPAGPGGPDGGVIKGNKDLSGEVVGTAPCLWA